MGEEEWRSGVRIGVIVWMERRRRGKRSCMEWLECVQHVVRKWVVGEK